MQHRGKIQTFISSIMILVFYFLFSVSFIIDRSNVSKSISPLIIVDKTKKIKSTDVQRDKAIAITFTELYAPSIKYFSGVILQRLNIPSADVPNKYSVLWLIYISAVFMFACSLNSSLVILAS